MATSGTTSFNMEVAQIIEEALERIGGNPTSGEEAASARTTLNLLLTHIINLSAPLNAQKLYNYTTTASTASYDMPDDVVNVLVVTISDTSGNEIELHRDDMMEYQRLYKKDQLGRPTTYYMQRLTDKAQMYLWPMPDTEYTVHCRVTRKLQDVNAAINNLDLPTIYLPAIISGLAYYLSLKRRNIDAQYRQELKMLYETELKAALEEDRTRTDYFVRPSLGNNGGR